MTADKNVEDEGARPHAFVPPDLRELYQRYGCCMAYIAVEKNGKRPLAAPSMLAKASL
jgi:hypothetical protein